MREVYYTIATADLKFFYLSWADEDCVSLTDNYKFMERWKKKRSALDNLEDIKNRAKRFVFEKDDSEIINPELIIYKVVISFDFEKTDYNPRSGIIEVPEENTTIKQVDD